MTNCKWHTDGTSPLSAGQREVFVFGSNLDGSHDGGAALEARNKFGARDSFAIGFVGRNAYGIATLDCSREKIEKELIKSQVSILRKYIEAYNNLEFFITRIGCGLAGFKDIEIAPMFKGFELLENVSLPENWKEFLI